MLKEYHKRGVNVEQGEEAKAPHTEGKSVGSGIGRRHRATVTPGIR